jgi:hypothetical protein
MNAILTAEREIKAPAAAVSDVSGAAEEIREGALAFVREKLTAVQRGLDLMSLLRRSEYFEIFKHGLALGVAHVLASTISGCWRSIPTNFRLTPTLKIVSYATRSDVAHAPPGLDAFGRA